MNATRRLLLFVWIAALPAAATFVLPQDGAPSRGNAARVIRKPPITALAITPDERGFVVGSQAGVWFRPFEDVEPRAGDAERQILTELDNVHALAFSPDGETLAIAGGTPGEEGIVELRSWPNGELIGQLEGHEDVVYDVIWIDPNGVAPLTPNRSPRKRGEGSRNSKTLVVTASADRTIRVWDAASRELREKLTGHSGPVLCLAISSDGKLLCSGSADQTIRVWDTTTWQLVRSLNNHLGPVHALAFRPALKHERSLLNGPHLDSLPEAERARKQPDVLASAGGDNTVRIWQPTIGRMVRIVRHPCPVFSLSWSLDGKVLASGAKDGRLRTIDADGDMILAERTISSGWLLSLARRMRDGSLAVGTSRGEIEVVLPSIPK